MNAEVTKYAVLMPVLNPPSVIEHLVARIREYGLPIIFVNDGSHTEASALITSLVAKSQGDLLEVHAINQGKGAAIKTGLRLAAKNGFSHVVQMDADAQHDVADLPRFIELSKNQPKALIVGIPEYDDSVPTHRYYCRYATHIWVWINTLSLSLKDSMCGFRVYPVKQSCDLVNGEYMGDRMDFDSEFLVRWYWKAWAVEQVKTRVKYPEEGVSHFNPFRDNGLITWMHTRLFFGMLKRIPLLLRRKVSHG